MSLGTLRFGLARYKSQGTSRGSLGTSGGSLGTLRFGLARYKSQGTSRGFGSLGTSRGSLGTLRFGLARYKSQGTSRGSLGTLSLGLVWLDINPKGPLAGP